MTGIWIARRYWLSIRSQYIHQYIMYLGGGKTYFLQFSFLVLTACGTKFDGSRTGNDSEFIMEYSVLNTTDAQDLTVESGDTISANIVVDKGSLSIKIQKDGEEPIYESDGISASNEFDVEIDESGTYTVEVTGKKAKGSVSFTVVTNQ